MLTKSIVLPPEAFFHARPAALTAAAAKPFQSVVLVMVGAHLAPAANPIALMRLPRPENGRVELMADGEDEAAALEAVEQAILGAF